MGDNSKPTQNSVLSFELTDLRQPRSAVATIQDTLGEE